MLFFSANEVINDIKSAITAPYIRVSGLPLYTGIPVLTLLRLLHVISSKIMRRVLRELVTD